MGKRVSVVTGANTGIGLETARGLARRGDAVVITARDRAKGERALEDLKATTGNAAIELLDLDLASLASVRTAAAELLARHDRIDVLVNNAGLVLTERRTTADGFEASFGINHLGHFLWTQLLLERLRATARSRIVNVSSDLHRRSRGLDFDDLMCERRPYSGFGAYADSKLANVLFTRELARRLEGTEVVTHALHPGVVNTQFGADGDTKGWFTWGVQLVRPLLLTPEKGARTSLHCATSDEAGRSTGLYWSKSRAVSPSRAARDDEAARRLWSVSERLVGLAN